MSQQPEALRLAEALERNRSLPCGDNGNPVKDSATELRRLHAENERLRDLIMRRPALNVGILHAYVKWNAECYAATAIPAPEANAVAHDAR